MKTLNKEKVKLGSNLRPLLGGAKVDKILNLWVNALIIFFSEPGPPPSVFSQHQLFADLQLCRKRHGSERKITLRKSLNLPVYSKNGGGTV